MGYTMAVSKVQEKLSKAKPGDYRLVLMDAKEVRSVPANAYYWGVVLKYACAEIGEASRSKMHEYMKLQFNADCLIVKGEVQVIPGSTQNMGKREFGQYVEDIKIWLLTEYGVRVPEPNEIPDDVYLEMVELGYVK